MLSPAAAKNLDVVKNRPASMSVTFTAPSSPSLKSTQYAPRAMVQWPNGRHGSSVDSRDVDGPGN